MFQQSMFELDDISNYSEGNNHRLPQHVFQLVDFSGTQGDCAKSSVDAGKKVADITAVAKNIVHRPEETTIPGLREVTAPKEKDFWSSTPNAIFPETRNSVDKIFPDDDSLLGNRGSETHSDLYPLGDIYAVHGDLNIFGNEHENQDCSYLSYEWPGISYTENFDGLFRSSDSSYLQEDVTNDEMSWFSSSSNAMNESRDASQPSFNTLCSGSSVKHDEANVYHVPHSGTPNSDEKNDPSSYSTMHHSFYESLLGANAESMPEPVSTEQYGTLRRPQIKSPKQAELKRKYEYPEHSSGGLYLVQEEFENPTKRSTDSSPNVVTAVRSDKNAERLQPHNLMNLAAAQVDRQTHVGFESQSEVEKDSDSSVLLESSGMSSVEKGKITVEETNFEQLQFVMEQLDFRTKLCIRDSLYRLARSAELRNNVEHSVIGSRDEREICGGIASEETNKLFVFADVETETNPIDRSIAHLLFHKPTTQGTTLESYY